MQLLIGREALGCVYFKEEALPHGRKRCEPELPRRQMTRTGRIETYRVREDMGAKKTFRAHKLPLLPLHLTPLTSIFTGSTVTSPYTQHPSRAGGQRE